MAELADGRPTVDLGSTPFRRRALMFGGPGRIEFLSEDVPPLRADEVYARTIMSGISHGTEMAWLRGEAAALHRRWDPDRRAYFPGAGRGYPVAPGYETVGTVVATGSDTGDVGLGATVYLDRPHADGHVVSALTAGDGRLPAGTPPERAIFWTLARVALGGVHDASIQLGESVVVIGVGTVGLLAVQLARLAGARSVVAVDRYRRRLDAAAKLGANVIDATIADVGAEVRRFVGSVGADAAIEASGSYSGLHEAIRSCRMGGRVATVASYHGEQSWRGISSQSSQSGLVDDGKRLSSTGPSRLGS